MAHLNFFYDHFGSSFKLKSRYKYLVAAKIQINITSKKRML